MLTMDQIHHIRALYYEQGYNISEIAKVTARDQKTVAKYIDMADFNEPLPIPASEQVFCPKLDPYKPLIDNWLEEDKKYPRKQRYTATKVYDRLKKEVTDFDITRTSSCIAEQAQVKRYCQYESTLSPASATILSGFSGQPRW